VRPKLVEPAGQCWPDIKIINELGKRLGFDEYFWPNVDECLDFILEPSGHDYESFKAVMALGPDRDHKEKDYAEFRTRSGKIEIFSPALERWQAPPLAEYSEPAEPDERYPLVLASGKDRAFFHTALRNIPSLRKLTPKPPVLVHPDLARERGLSEGQEAIIETAVGSIKQYVVLDDALDPRVVYADYGWWFAEKGADDLYGWQDSNINILTDDTRFVEPLIGTTTQRGMYCNIRSATE
jgi:anaerobic selenocysteine-containing dehydrogenase